MKNIIILKLKPFKNLIGGRKLMVVFLLDDTSLK